MFNTILKEAIETAKKECKNEYAQTYLREIPEVTKMYGEDGFDAQLLYAFSNMNTWRGEKAREAKAIIKAYLKSKKHI
jgi:hypothetical protein